MSGDSRLYPGGKGGVAEKYNGQVLEFLDQNAAVIASFDPLNRRFDVPSGSSLRIGGNTLTGAELGALDAVTLGTKAASKAVTLDSNQECDGLGDIRVQDKIITTTQVKALNGTPITIVAAVGATNYFEFVGAYVFMDYLSAQYASDAGEDLVFQNLSAGDTLTHDIDGSLFHGAADALVIARHLAADASEIDDAVLNGGVEVTIKVGEWITGDSPLKIRVFYRVIRTASMVAIA